jgi:hypothetical protein
MKAVLGFTLLLMSGCMSATVTEEARWRAVTDLSCPVDRIFAYEAEGNAVVARGCGAWTQYECFRTHGANSTPICVREAPAVVTPDTTPVRITGDTTPVQITRNTTPVQITRDAARAE